MKKIKITIDYRYQHDNYYLFTEEGTNEKIYIHKEHSVWQNLKVKRRKKYIFTTSSVESIYNLEEEINLEEKEVEISHSFFSDIQTSNPQPTKYKLEDFEKWLEKNETNRAGIEKWWEYFINWHEERPNVWDRTIEVGWSRADIEKTLEDWKTNYNEASKQEVEVFYKTIFIWKLEVDSVRTKIEKKPEVKKAITLQQHLDNKYPTQQAKKGIKTINVEIINQVRRSQKINGLLEGGELDLSEYPDLEIVWINGSDLKTKITKLTLANQSKLKELKCYNNQLTSLDVSHNSKLTDLYVDAELFYPENKIMGLEKVSIVRFDCRGGNLLQKSDNPQFIWEVLQKKYQTIFPEMELIKTEDLDNLANQLNKETAKDETFLKQFCNEKIVKSKKGKFYWILDCLANQFLARCLVVQNRLTQGKSEEYEKHLIERAQKAECQAMNPQEFQKFSYKDRSERVKKVLEGDNKLLEKLQDLPYLKIEKLSKRNEVLEQSIAELENKLSHLKTIETLSEESETIQIKQKEQVALIQEKSLIPENKK